MAAGLVMYDKRPAHATALSILESSLVTFSATSCLVAGAFSNSNSARARAALWRALPYPLIEHISAAVRPSAPCPDQWLGTRADCYRISDQVSVGIPETQIAIRRC